MMQLPFFTTVDKELVRGDSTRDPLGLIPVWSKVGHDLIPGLATIVSRIDGIQGVIFLYTCLNELSPEIRAKRIDEKVLKFLERLWEYHLKAQQNGRGPCFGINSLGSVDFQLSSSKPGTVGTGLRQYYRGTCVNKKIISSDLKILLEPYRSLGKKYLDGKFFKWINAHAANMGRADYSISAKTAYEEVHGFLEKFSTAGSDLWEALEKSLINDEEQKHWIVAARDRLSDQTSKDYIPRELASVIQTYANELEDEVLARKCQNILHCEPFLQVVESVFRIVQEAPRTTLADLTQRLSRAAPQDLIEVCRNFKTIQISTPRFEKLKKLADRLVAKDYRGFIHEFLLEYYIPICKSRGKAPILQVDGDLVIALSPLDTSEKWQESSSRWRYGYFLETQISLFADLESRKGYQHG